MMFSMVSHLSINDKLIFRVIGVRQSIFNKPSFLTFFRPEEYKKKVSEYVRKYASEEALRQAEATAVSSSSESSMSDFSEDEAQVLLQF